MDQIESSPTSVVLDNALVFSAANFFYRSKNSMNVRGVNLLGLSALADALVMHDRLTVDRNGWEFLSEMLPPQWLPSIQPIVDVVDYEFPAQEAVVDALFENNNGALLCYATTVFDNAVSSNEGHDLNNLYFAYTNNDLGANGLRESELIEYISQRLPNIPDMHFYLRNSDHVSGLQCLVRALQYEYFAADIGRPYVPHDFRGRMLNILARSQSDATFGGLWRDMMASMKLRIKSDYAENLDWTSVTDAVGEWERFQSPLFLAMAMQNASALEDIFFEIEKIRERARPIRRLFEDYVDPSIPAKADLSKELKALMFEIGKTAPNHGRTTFSLSLGFPLSVSLGVNLGGKSKYKSVAFVRDIYDNHSVPFNLTSDVERLFPVRLLPLTYERPSIQDPEANLADFVLNGLKEHQIIGSDSVTH